ncbi:DUF3828 domain-containing protein [Accumulibacter sp.]|uniref:DUF3828 domain-containing protein n=2 Tax=Accumulibacter sp. TaxID=2053492 RepID=UPI001AC3BD3B|nr:DUF3828 domain-containing protein [Accumulibacter sp.]MBN8517172.1 DUF3828 domain-containing protein [Accumulibacter sp.]MCM8580832.1 DUF3828 domain-containing protein [Accumulibacter sp.]MCM8620199.1 DUF3828 domain-containing protein [Accumulibacter sp.]
MTNGRSGALTRAFRRRWRAVRRTVVASFLVASFLFLAAHGAGAFEAWLPQADWRFERGVVAPWAPAKTQVPTDRRLAGKSLRFTPTRVEAPEPLACAAARYEFVLTPAPGLFQGSLPPPAEQAARRLGIAHLPLLSLQVTCDNGLFDYHLITSRKALLGLDNVVWTLSRAAEAESPEAATLNLLHVHMTHDMVFDAASVARKRAYLTPGLRGAIADYFKRPRPQDEVPPINGDPFTDSQEYPDRFLPGRARIDGARASVPIRLGDGSRDWQVEVLLLREGSRWRVDDLRYPGGATLRGLLQPAPS